MTEHAFEGRLYPWHDDRPDSWVFVALPVKKPVRRSEQLDVDDVATFTIRVLD